MKSILIALLILLSSNAFATIYTFTGVGLWSVPANWAGNAVHPTNMVAGDSIVIESNGNCVIDVDITIKNEVAIIVGSNSTLIVNQSRLLINNGSISCYGILQNSGTISTFSDIQIENGGTVQNQSSGYIGILYVGEIFFIGTGAFVNDGIINFERSSIGIYLGPVILQNNGTLSGNGSIERTTSNNATGNINPGNGSGNLYFTSLLTSGNINIEVGGLTENVQHDIITVFNRVVINGGTLNVSLINGFLPQSGQAFTIILNGLNLGYFSQVNFPAVPGISWTTEYFVDKTVIQTLTTLAVRYLSFTGRTTGNEVQLNWQTALPESNNAGFNIERSADGVNWATIGFKAPGSNGIYSFADSLPFAGVNYYRLKQLDANGASTYSPIVNVQTAISSWKVYPNPAHNHLWVQGQTTTNTTAYIYTIAGTLMKEVKLVNGRIDISNLPTSLFLLKISDQGKTFTFPFIKN